MRGENGEVGEKAKRRASDYMFEGAELKVLHLAVFLLKFGVYRQWCLVASRRGFGFVRYQMITLLYNEKNKNSLGTKVEFAAWSTGDLHVHTESSLE